MMRFAPPLIACLVIGCTSPRYLWSQADKRYTAVKIKDWEREGSQSRTIRVLLVHGMGNHPFGTLSANEPELFHQSTYRALQSQLAAWEHNPQLMAPVIRAAMQSNWSDFIRNASNRLHHEPDERAGSEFRLVPDGGKKPSGYVFTRSFKHNTNGVALKFYVANWGLGAAVAKEARFGSWNGLGSHPDGYIAGDVSDFDHELNANRVALTKALKLHVMDWGLGDAALYLRGAGESFREPVAVALRQLLKECGPNDRIAVVTHSLGSTITLDALVPYLEEDGAASAANAVPGRVAGKLAFVARPTEGERASKPSGLAFYMFANQYGLLTIGAEESLEKLNRALAESGSVRGKAAVQVYAFTDPNDLLSYPLNLNGPAKRSISVCNVYVRNHAVNLGFLIEPLEAHVNYESNKYVLEAMLNSPANVRLPDGAGESQ